MKLMIVDDHPVFRQGIVALFTHSVEGCVVLQAENAMQALELMRSHSDIDVVLLDIVMPGCDGIPAISELRRVRPNLPIIMLSASEDTKDVVNAMSLGALGYVPKSANAKAIVSAVTLGMSGQSYVPPMMMMALSAAVAQRQTEFERLTQRQVDVLRLIAKGLPNRSIATALELSEKTVKVHITSIFKALKVINRTQAMIVGRDLGLL